MTIATSPAFAAPYAPKYGRWLSATSEPTKMTSPHWRNHAGEYGSGQPAGPDQMDLDLRFECLGIDFVQSAKIRVSSTGNQYLDVTQLFAGLQHEFLD